MFSLGKQGSAWSCHGTTGEVSSCEGRLCLGNRMRSHPAFFFLTLGLSTKSQDRTERSYRTPLSGMCQPRHPAHWPCPAHGNEFGRRAKPQRFQSQSRVNRVGRKKPAKQRVKRSEGVLPVEDPPTPFIGRAGVRGKGKDVHTISPHLSQGKRRIGIGKVAVRSLS